MTVHRRGSRRWEESGIFKEDFFMECAVLKTRSIKTAAREISVPLEVACKKHDWPDKETACPVDGLLKRAGSKNQFCNNRIILLAHLGDTRSLPNNTILKDAGYNLPPLPNFGFCQRTQVYFIGKYQVLQGIIRCENPAIDVSNLPRFHRISTYIYY